MPWRKEPSLAMTRKNGGVSSPISSDGTEGLDGMTYGQRDPREIALESTLALTQTKSRPRLE